MLHYAGCIGLSTVPVVWYPAKQVARRIGKGLQGRIQLRNVSNTALLVDVLLRYAKSFRVYSASSVSLLNVSDFLKFSSYG
jgi:hypothetical protein